MISVNADLVQMADADTLKVRLKTPLVIDNKDKEAWPKGSKGDESESYDAQRYEVREQVWVRLEDLDAHESYTEAGKDETDSFRAWLDTAESEWDEDEYELEVYAAGREAFSLGRHDRVLAGLARKYDGDRWETSLPTVHGNAVMWRDQSPPE